MSAADKLLARLKRVRRTGPGRWIASSPTREDRSPSLVIRELEDGRVLLHDFGGDDVEAVLDAVGLTLRDLFPTVAGGAAPVAGRRFNAVDVLALVAFEASVAVVVCADVLQQRAITEASFDRLLLAAKRLGDAAEVCNANR